MSGSDIHRRSLEWPALVGTGPKANDAHTRRYPADVFEEPMSTVPTSHSRFNIAAGFEPV